MTGAPCILAAEFTNGSKTRPARLDFTVIDPARGERKTLSSVAVSGKREARQLAAKRGAKPWNF